MNMIIHIRNVLGCFFKIFMTDYHNLLTTINCILRGKVFIGYAMIGWCSVCPQRLYGPELAQHSEKLAQQVL